MQIRPADRGDDGAVWAILEPVFRAGKTYTQPRDITREAALAYWWRPGNAVFVAEDDDRRVLGTYSLRANQGGGGSHVANGSYAIAPDAGGRGIGRALCLHSLEEARRGGFRAMQFNFVVSANAAAVHLWQACGFEIVGRLPQAFEHPALGFVDALVMFRTL